MQTSASAYFEDLEDSDKIYNKSLRYATAIEHQEELADYINKMLAAFAFDKPRKIAAVTLLSRTCLDEDGETVDYRFEDVLWNIACKLEYFAIEYQGMPDHLNLACLGEKKYYALVEAVENLSPASTPTETAELRKDKQAITAQSDKLCEIFQEQREDEPDIESIYEALTGSLSQKV